MKIFFYFFLYHRNLKQASNLDKKNLYNKMYSNILFLNKLTKIYVVISILHKLKNI